MSVTNPFEGIAKMAGMILTSDQFYRIRELATRIDFETCGPDPWEHKEACERANDSAVELLKLLEEVGNG